MQLDDALRDRQTQAGSVGVRVRPMESLEDALQVLGTDPRAIVGNLERDPAV
jgi:hypothetical protein